ncbi:MAG: neurogenic locus notch [Legionellaceae bacterium]|nr:neurogenic locus notch [Legionellaceae bacterium]
MRSLNLLFLVASLTIPITATAACSDNCCDDMGGIQYCDSSAGRYVCQNGRYSSCYCTRRAIMNMQAFEGCCMWKGGVLRVDDRTGYVICNNGGVSPMCTLGNPEQEAVIGRQEF